VFDSGALHFASNGAEGINGALYHGLITPGAVPRLRLAAARAGSRPVTGAYSGHLFAPELLRLVERQLAAFYAIVALMNSELRGSRVRAAFCWDMAVDGAPEPPSIWRASHLATECLREDRESSSVFVYKLGAAKPPST